MRDANSTAGGDIERRRRAADRAPLTPGVKRATRQATGKTPTARATGARPQAAATPAARRTAWAPIPKAATSAGFPDDGPAAEVQDQTISGQILEQLEQYNLLATCQLRIEVLDGVVVATGEVPGPYEKQLVAHFCRKAEGVVQYVDRLTVRQEHFNSESENRAPTPRRQPRQPIEWRLPFRAWNAAAALGLLALAWGAISLARGQGGPERLAVYPLTGTFAFEGEPAMGAALVLYPKDESISARPRAMVNEDGTFAVTTYEPGDGAPPGEYKVTVEWRRPVNGQHGGGDDLPPPNVLPPAYSNPRTTPLVVAVEEGENEFPPITFRN
jgi:hypothetical protein